MTQIELNDKLDTASVTRFDDIQFQLYPYTNDLTSSEAKNRIANRYKYEIEIQKNKRLPSDINQLTNKQKHYLICNWYRGHLSKVNRFESLTLKSGLQTLISSLNSGFSMHFGITYGRCDAINVERYDIIYLDYDAYDSEGNLKPNAATLQQLLDLPFIKKYCCFYQFSSKGEPNTHFYIVLDKSIKSAEKETLIKYLNELVNSELNGATENFLPFDNSTKSNSTHITYGNNNQCVVLNSSAMLPTSEYLIKATDYELSFESEQLSIPKAEDTKDNGKRSIGVAAIHKLTGENKGSVSHQYTSKNKKDSSKKTESVNEYVARNDREANSYTEAILNYMHDVIWVGVCGQDIEKQFPLHDHNFSNKPVGIPKNGRNMVGKWEGANPFSETNSSGSSFYVCYYDGLMPTYTDGSHNKKLSPLRFGDHIIKYWHHCLSPNNPYPLPAHIQELGLEKKYPKDLGECFKLVLNDIYDFYQVPPYQPSIEWLVGQFYRDLGHKCFTIGWGDALLEGVSFYCCFDDRYRSYSSGNFCRELKEIANRDYPFVDKYLAETDEKYQGLVKTLLGWFVNNKSPFKILDSRPMPDSKYYVFANGCFNLDTKQLETNEGQAFNMVAIEQDFKVIGDDNEGVTAWQFWANGWMDAPEKREYLLKYSILSLQGRAGTLESFPHIWGNRGTGKSTWGQELAQMFPLSNKRPIYVYSGEQPLKDNTHSSAMLEGKKLWIIAELSSNISNLLEYYGTAGTRYININPKNQETRTIILETGLISDSENLPVIPPNKLGYYRRMCFLESTYFPQAKEYIEIVQQNRFDIFCWALQRNSDELITELRELSKCELFNNNRIEMQRANSSLSDYIEEYIQITNDNSQEIRASELFAAYVKHAENRREKIMDSKTFGKYLNKDLKNLDWKGNTRRSNGQSIYSGVRLNLQPDQIEVKAKF